MRTTCLWPTAGFGKAWTRTPQQLLQECATESCEWGRDHLEAEEDQLIQGFMDSGMQVDILTEDQLQAFKDAVAGVTAELKTEYGEDACAAFGIN